jgi:rare lipoprotein A (peptidoglycan hydrolase)
MKTGWNRHGRKDHPRGARVLGERRSRHAGISALLAIVLALAWGASLAQAVTGGASPVATTGSVAGGGLAFSAMKTAGATWYGPGLYGNHTACGQTLLPQTIGVAHRSLPCGTAVKFNYQGRSVIARVIDRGPYSDGFSWDLTNGARRLLGFEGAGPIRYAVELKFARR